METSGRHLEETRVLTPRTKPQQFLDRSARVFSERCNSQNFLSRAHSPVTFSLSSKVDGIWDRTTKNAFSHERQKGPRIRPPHDGAGLLGGSRCHGRNTPLRGKGIGPPEGRDEGGGRPHLSCTSPYSPRLHPRDVTGQHGHAGMEDETHRRPSKRTLPGADARKGYALRGAAAAVDAPDMARRRLQGEGTPPASARVATHLRIMCVGSGLTQADVDPGMRQKNMPLLDLHTPRPHYKLDSRRTPAPHTVPRRPGTAAAAYGDAKSGYLTNRVRADGVENILGRQALDF